MNSSIVYVIDDDATVARQVTDIGEGLRIDCRYFSDVASCMTALAPMQRGFLIADLRIGVGSGLELTERLCQERCPLPVIIYTSHATIPLVVRAMRAGTLSVIEKSAEPNDLWEAMAMALTENDRRRQRREKSDRYQEMFGTLVESERNVLKSIVAGRPNKEIAAELGVSVRTVETRRQSIFRKLQVDHVAALICLYCDMRHASAAAETNQWL